MHLTENKMQVPVRGGKKGARKDHLKNDLSGPSLQYRRSLVQLEVDVNRTAYHNNSHSTHFVRLLTNIRQI